MNGYMIHHEAAINSNAKRACSLAAEYDNLIETMEAITRMPDWESSAADSQRAEINDIIRKARDAADSLRQISNTMYEFTATHKTWLEDVVDFITG